METETRALTVGRLAERLGVPIHRIEYLVRARDIRPVQRAGHLRIYDEQAEETLRKELAGQRGRL